MKKHDYLVGLLISLAAFVYYFNQSCPTFYYWDSAELAAAIAGNGIPHPPGFPLYLLLVKSFSYLVPNDAARATSIFSAFCAAFAAGLFYLTLIKMFSVARPDELIKRIISLGLSMVLIFSYSLSAQATRAEVYSLNFLLFLMAIYFSSDLLFDDLSLPKKSRSYIISQLFIGFGLANHHLTIFLILPATIFLAIRANLKPKSILYGIFALIIPMSLYFYLILLARRGPDLNWGNPIGIKALIDIITAKGFNKPASALSISHIIDNFSSAISLLYKQVGPIIMFLSLLGVLKAFKEKSKIGSFLILILSFNMCSTLLNEYYYYENLDFHGYLLISLAALLMLAAIGTVYILKKIPEKRKLIVSSLIVIIAATIPGYANVGNASLAKNQSARQFAAVLADECPKGALVIASSYNSFFILKAYQIVYGQRQDLTIINCYLLGQKWYREYLIRRCNLQHLDKIPEEAEQFYRYLINYYKNSSEILIEYDDFSSPLRNYLWPQNYFMRFKGDSFDFQKYGGEDSVKANLRYFEKYLHSGTDYEELKCMLWLLDNRAKFYQAVGKDEISKSYLDEIDKLTDNYFKAN